MPENQFISANASVNEMYYCDRDSATATGRYLTKVEWNFIARHLCRTPARKYRIADMGGGSGRFALPLYSRGMDVVVEEVDRLPLQLLHEKNPAIPVILQDPQARSFPIDDHSFDFMLCIEVPDLIESDWFFSEARRILKKEGRLILTTHNRFSYKGFYKKVILREDERNDYWYRIHYRSSFSQVKKRLGYEGFKVIDAQGFHWIPVSRASNNKLIPLFVNLEKIFHLGSLISISPWVILIVQKK